jgi:hypothetical protein
MPRVRSKRLFYEAITSISPEPRMAKAILLRINISLFQLSIGQVGQLNQGSFMILFIGQVGQIKIPRSRAARYEGLGYIPTQIA